MLARSDRRFIQILTLFIIVIRFLGACFFGSARAAPLIMFTFEALVLHITS